MNAVENVGFGCQICQLRLNVETWIRCGESRPHMDGLVLFTVPWSVLPPCSQCYTFDRRTERCIR